MKSRYKASICNLKLVNYFDDHYEFYDECESCAEIFFRASALTNK